MRKTGIVVTEVRSDNPPRALSGDIPREDAYMVGLQLRAYPKHEHVEDGRVVARNGYQAGETCFYDLRRGHAFMMVRPFHSIHFLLTRRTLNALAEDAHARWAGELNHRAGVSVSDATVRRLGETVLPVLNRPEQAGRLFLDHVTLAPAAHVIESYGGMRRVAGTLRAGWRHGRRAGRGKSWTPTSRGNCPSPRWRRNVACRRATSPERSANRSECRPTGGCSVCASGAPRS